jgi:hypothetical protein
MYASNTDRADFCDTVTSALRFGFELNVLGRERTSGWAEYGYTDKLWALSEFIARIRNDSNTIIVFVDAYDIIFAGGPTQLAEKLFASPHRLIFSSEKGCCPDWSTAVHYAMDRRPGVWTTGCSDGWPPAPFGVVTPFLNSGAIIGFAPELSLLLERARREYDASRHAARVARGGGDEPLRIGDQELLCHLYSNVSAASAPGGGGGGAGPHVPLRNALRIGIDYSSDIFLSMHGVDLAREIAYTPDGRLFLTGALPPPPLPLPLLTLLLLPPPLPPPPSPPLPSRRRRRRRKCIAYSKTYPGNGGTRIAPIAPLPARERRHE